MRALPIANGLAALRTIHLADCAVHWAQELAR
jgi:hypothetical protein